MSPSHRPVLDGSVFAFLFSDIEGSTQRWERSPEAMGEALRRHDAVMQVAMERHNGHVFKTMGDAYCVAFPLPLDAVAAALEAQRALAQLDFDSVGGLRVRIGVHYGPAELRENDYFGPSLNRVARLMSTAHGSQIVVSKAVAARVRDCLPGGAFLHDLGEHRLKDLAEPEHVFQLMAPDLPAHFPPLKSAGTHQHNLPEHSASFIGREAETEALGRLIAQHRLVTMLGSGGLGKTRLSIRVGLHLLGSFPDGVWLVELAPLSDPLLVAETICGLFAVAVPAGRSAGDALAGALKRRRLLLILDNCEHLVAAAATLAATLLRECPDVRILATSREPLGIAGEAIFRMPSLAVPPRRRTLSAAEALQSPAVRLFVERGAAALGGFVLSDADAAAVAGICRRLDGIPLALELAAPRLKMLKPAALLARLDDRFRLLTGGSRTATRRQQTLRGLIDWSHDLLGDAEKALMRRLSVFAGGWTLEAAVAVAAGDGVDDFETFDLLASLVDKSLVQSDLVDGETRYGFFESTRHYAAEKLAEAGESHVVARLAGFLAGLLREAETNYETASTLTWCAIYGPEIDNVRAALDWAFGPAGDPALGLEITAYSSWLWSELDLAAEERRRLEVATTHLDAATPPAIAARISYMRTAVQGTGRSGSREDARRAVELSRASGDRVALGRALVHLARTLATPATLDEMKAVLDEALPLARAGGRTKLLASVLNALGVAAYFESDLKAAQRRFEESLDVARALHDVQGISSVIQNVAELQFLAGEVPKAIETAREGIQVAEDARDRASECVICANLAAYLLQTDQLDDGAATAVRAFGLARDLEEDAVALLAIQHLAAAAALRRNMIDALHLQGYADAAYAREDAMREPTEQASADIVAARAAGTLEEAEIRRLSAEGAGMTLDEIADLTPRIAGPEAPGSVDMSERFSLPP